MEKQISIKILIFVFFIGVLLAQDPCQPLWPRLEFGNIYSDQNSNEKLIIKFNTRSLCQNSFVVLTNNAGSIRKVFCESSSLIMSEKMKKYQVFQQRCSISEIEFDQKIQYIAYGANSSAKSIPYSPNPLETSLIHPNSTKPTKLIVLADWGELHTKVNKYTSINNTLDMLRESTDINGMVINGDIAYDLDSNNGQNYEDFLNILSRVARYVPVLINTGNHEHNSPDDLKLFYFTFEQYGKDKNLALGLSLGQVFLVGFDPYDSLYVNNIERYLKRETEQVVETQAYLGLREKLLKGENLNKTIITSSHYPLACSAPDPKCSNDRQLLKDFFDLMFTSNVPLYICAHVHTYERIYPLCQNGSFITKETPFTFTPKENCLTSIIEGTAGNDVQIVEKYEHIQQYTAKVSYGKTGVGFVEIGEGYIKYQHYSSERGLSLQDEIKIFLESSKESDQKFKELEQ